MFATLRAKGLLWPALMVTLCVPVLVMLGNWQMTRKTWKEGLIASIEARTKAPPVSLAEAHSLLALKQDIEYLRVKVRGRFLNDKELYLYDPGPEGPGWDVITPLEPEGGGTVLVNRGYVPDRLRDPAARPGATPSSQVEVTGLVRAPAKSESFTPANDPARNIWYWRDFSAMFSAAFRNTERPYSPFFLDAEADTANPAAYPRGGATLLTLSNKHLEYALTWYGFALSLIGVFLVYAIPRFKGGETP